MNKIPENPKISVIVPVFNVEKYLKRCLDSILTQTYWNLEVLCIDDGSEDHSLEILKFYEKKDSRVRVYTQARKGPSAARNRGLDEATGDFISFVDADDYISWNAYEILTAVARNNGLDLIIFGAECFPLEKGPEWMWNIINTKYHYYQHCDGKKVVFWEHSCRPFLWMHFISRDLLEKPEPIRFDETLNLAEDQLFQFQYLPRAAEIMVLEDKLYHYRVSRSGSLMQMYMGRKTQKIKVHITLVEKVIDSWRRMEIYEEEEDQFLTWAVNFLYWSIVELPDYFKNKYAALIIRLFEEKQCRLFLVDEAEQKHLLELKEWSLLEGAEVDSVADLEQRMEEEKYQIREILKSRAFRLGRILTPKEERLDLKEFEV